VSYQGARRGDYVIPQTTTGLIADMIRLDSRIDRDIDRIESKISEYAGAAYVLAVVVGMVIFI